MTDEEFEQRRALLPTLPQHMRTNVAMAVAVCEALPPAPNTVEQGWADGVRANTIIVTLERLGYTVVPIPPAGEQH